MWTKEKYRVFWKEALQKTDENYRLFSQKIIQTNYPMLGIRTPNLQKMATAIAREDVLSYLKVALDKTYEEVLMQGFLLGKITEKGILKQALDTFLPKIDNWALCDMTVARLKLVAKEKDYFLKVIDSYLSKKDVYSKRVGLVLLLNYYVEDSFLEEIFCRIRKIKEHSYYVEMAIAWLLCECFIENQEQTFHFLCQEQLSMSILTKTVQKVCDSYRVSPAWKEKLKQLKQTKKELYSS